MRKKLQKPDCSVTLCFFSPCKPQTFFCSLSRLLWLHLFILSHPDMKPPPPRCFTACHFIVIDLMGVPPWWLPRAVSGLPQPRGVLIRQSPANFKHRRAPGWPPLPSGVRWPAGWETSAWILLPRLFPAGDWIDCFGLFLRSSALSGTESPSSFIEPPLRLPRQDFKRGAAPPGWERSRKRERGSHHLGDPPLFPSVSRASWGRSARLAHLRWLLSVPDSQLGSLKLNSLFDLCFSFRQETLLMSRQFC